MRVILIIACVIGAYILNALLFDFFVPNPCVYATGISEPGLIIEMFFTMNGSTGGHPEPNMANFLFTAITGLLVGFGFLGLTKNLKSERNGT